MKINFTKPLLAKSVNQIEEKVTVDTHSRDAVFENAGLLHSDFLYRIAKNGRVFQPQRGDATHDRAFYNVCCIVQPPEANLRRHTCITDMSFILQLNAATQHLNIVCTIPSCRVRW